VEPHHFYAAPAKGEKFDAAPAPAPTLLYSKPNFLKGIKVNVMSDILFSSDLCNGNCFTVNVKRKNPKNYSVYAIFIKLSIFNITVVAGAVRTLAGIASRYSSGSTKMMRLLADPASATAPILWFFHEGRFCSMLQLFKATDSQRYMLNALRMTFLNLKNCTVQERQYILNGLEHFLYKHFLSAIATVID
jgi:hypothetical protein